MTQVIVMTATCLRDDDGRRSSNDSSNRTEMDENLLIVGSIKLRKAGPTRNL